MFEQIQKANKYKINAYILTGLFIEGKECETDIPTKDMDLNLYLKE